MCLSFIKSKSYLGAQNEVKIPYLTQWNMSNRPNLKDLFTFLSSVISSDPPILEAIDASAIYRDSGKSDFPIAQPQ